MLRGGKKMSLFELGIEEDIWLDAEASITDDIAFIESCNID